MDQNEWITGSLAFSWAFLAIYLSNRFGFFQSDNKHHSFFYNFSFGVLSWFICYPVIFALDWLLDLILHKIYGPFEIDQYAVHAVKSSFNDPKKFALAAFNVVILAPLFEELLFRGVLQRFLRWIGLEPFLAILLTSLAFAFSHYTSNQGIYNFELIPVIFAFSCYLGYIYFRRGSIWAPIGLHMMFNFFTIVSLLAEYYVGG